MALESIDLGRSGIKPLHVLHGKGLVLTGLACNGFTNANYHLYCLDGEYLLRIPQHPARLAQTILDTQEEMKFTGFEEFGGTWRMRTPEEQANFSLKALSCGLSVIPLYYMGDQRLIMPYIEQAISLREHLLNGGLKIADAVLDHLRLAHKHNIVFGDRWTNNTLIAPDERIIEIDYDIALNGPCAKEFELAQFLFHVVHFSADRRRMIALLENNFHSNPIRGDYDVDFIRLFMRNYVSHFGRIGQYEGLPVISHDEVASVLEVLGNQRDIT